MLGVNLGWTSIIRVVSRFLSSRFHPKIRQLLSSYFSNIMLQTDLLTFRVAAAVFGIAGGMRQLLAYFDNPASYLRGVEIFMVTSCYRKQTTWLVYRFDSTKNDAWVKCSHPAHARLDIVVFSDQIMVVILARHWQELTATLQQFSLLTSQKLQRWLWMTTVLILL